MPGTTVIRNNLDGIDSALELLNIVERNLILDTRNNHLHEASQQAALKAKDEISKARAQLVEARAQIERIRVPKASNEVHAIHEPERQRVIR